MNRSIRIVPSVADYNSEEPYRLDWINVLIWIPIPLAWTCFLGWLVHRVLS